VTDNGTARSTAALSVVEVAAWVEFAAGLASPVSRMAVGEEAWALLRPALAPASRPSSDLDRFLAVPIEVDHEGDPYRWMMLNHAGRVLSFGRLG
jgi:hypothetical protein